MLQIKIFTLREPYMCINAESWQRLEQRVNEFCREYNVVSVHPTESDEDFQITVVYQTE